VFCRVAWGSLPALLLLASCARGPEAPAIQRLAVLRFENLSGDPSLDWMGRALSETITAELGRSATLYAIPSSRLHSLNQALGIRPISAPGISAEAPLAQALNASLIGYGYYTVEGGFVQAHLTIENPRTRRMVQSLTSVASRAPDIVPVANSLAHGISPQAQSWPARSPDALRSYAIALESSDAAAMERDAAAAIAADPDLARPYLLLAELKARRQDRAGAQDVLQSALGRQGIDASDRAEIEAAAAGLHNDLVGREHALILHVRLAPNDAAAWRALAELNLNGHRFVESLQAYKRALAIEPEDANTWNEAGYAAAYAGNLPAAMSALRRYQALRPSDANPLDSMGDVSLMLGRLGEAERFYLDAAKKDPNFLNGADTYKAAMAHLMTGDVPSADAIFRQRFSQPNPEWLWVTGRRQEAYALLQQQVAAAANSPAVSAGWAELALWSLWLDNRTAAAEMARKSVESAVPASANLAALARFLAQPPASATEWTARAGQAFANPTARDLALAYALLLAREFAPAADILRRIYEANPVHADGSIPIELAWALIETGNTKDAAPLLRLNPIPGPNGPGPFIAFYFPRVFDLRARVLEGVNPQDAAANRRIFEALSK
jgi:tetratricopeptide (TPR) repeat protein